MTANEHIPTDILEDLRLDEMPHTIKMVRGVAKLTEDDCGPQYFYMGIEITKTTDIYEPWEVAGYRGLSFMTMTAARNFIAKKMA